jgi:prepilin-type processing-associated H-X9-DG protein
MEFFAEANRRKPMAVFWGGYNTLVNYRKQPYTIGHGTEKQFRDATEARHSGQFNTAFCDGHGSHSLEETLRH